MKIKLNPLSNVFLIIYIQCINIFTTRAQNCDNAVSKELQTEIQGYKEIANKIIAAVNSEPIKGQTYNNLANFADKFGARFTGTESLEKSIDWAVEKFKEDKLDNVQTEEVNIDHWIRGKESAALLSPREKNLTILGLGLTVPTPPEGITASAIVVKTFDELALRGKEAAGKIVVFNQEWGEYQATANYRKKGPVEAAKLGAVAVLVRSVTPFSINSAHTGQVNYKKDVKAIPVASVTKEDADLLYRLDKAGNQLKINLQLEAHLKENQKSRNVWGDLTGKEKPKNVVLSACHIDSWDVGEGVLDDAGGCIASLETINLFNFLNLRPRRTLRNIWFTSEEVNLLGAKHYVEKHAAEMDSINMIMELDHGLFQPSGWDYAGSDEGACIVKEILSLLEGKFNATKLRQLENAGDDTTPFTPKGVPSIMLNSDGQKYMWFHHTNGDTIDKYTPEEIDACLAAWAVTSYVIADLSVDIPRK